MTLPAPFTAEIGPILRREPFLSGEEGANMG
jgi:hypothetical protein